MVILCVLTMGAGGSVQVKAFVELAGSLLSAGAAKSQAGQPSGLSGEMLRCMRSAGVINALIGALKLIDMDHPNVRTTHSLPCSVHPFIYTYHLPCCRMAQRQHLSRLIAGHD